jgi:hypothetical protein
VRVLPIEEKNLCCKADKRSIHSSNCPASCFFQFTD